MGALKFDYSPLLAPGRHGMTLATIETLCVLPFEGRARAQRERLFYSLEDRLYGPHAVLKDVALALLEQGCLARSGSHEDGCWPNWTR
jgi:hypothetical protein